MRRNHRITLCHRRTKYLFSRRGNHSAHFESRAFITPAPDSPTTADAEVVTECRRYPKRRRRKVKRPDLKPLRSDQSSSAPHPRDGSTSNASAAYRVVPVCDGGPRRWLFIWPCC